MVQGLGFRVRVHGSEFGINGSEYGINGSEFGEFYNLNAVAR